MTNLKAAEFFAGSRSFGKVADELGIETFSIDWKPYEDIHYVGDVQDMKAEDVPFVPNIVWASPDCTTYTLAAISTHRNGTEPKTDYAAKCDEVNQHFISLVDGWLELNPDLLFYFENPRGMLGKMDWMQRFIKRTIWYCQYGDERAKPTHIFTNDRLWNPRPECWNGNKFCHHAPAPRGAKTGTQGRKGSYERSRVPEQLIREILASAISQLT